MRPKHAALLLLALALFTGIAWATTPAKPIRAAGGVSSTPQSSWNGGDGGTGYYIKPDAGMVYHAPNNVETTLGGGGGGSTGNWTFSGNNADISSGTLGVGASASTINIGNPSGGSLQFVPSGTLWFKYGATNYVEISYAAAVFMAPATDGGGSLGQDGQGWKWTYLSPKTAPGSPATSGEWVLYVDSGDGNKLKAKASTGTVVTLGTP